MPTYVVWDTETARFGPGHMAPPLACVAVRYAGGSHLFHHTEAEQFFDEVLYDPEYIHVGHNIVYDFAVIAAKYPKYLPVIFEILREGRARDTMIRQKLLDIAQGKFRGYYDEPTKAEKKEGKTKGRWVRLDYTLNTTYHRYTRKRLDKDTWQKRYGEFIDIPLSEWPEGAKAYPIGDVDATWDSFWGQERLNGIFIKELKEHMPRIQDPDPLADEASQLRALWWMQLMKNWGIRTDPFRVRKLHKQTELTYRKLERQLQNMHFCSRCADDKSQAKPVARMLTNGYCDKHGKDPTPRSLVKPDGVRDTKLAKLRMIEVMGGEGNCRRTKKDGISLDSDACAASEDPMLIEYAEITSFKTVLSKDIPALMKGRYMPIHSNFDSLIATGRTSSSKPNIQNIRRLPGIRECFVPRKGKVFLDADYDGMELRTLAQVCIDLFGFSVLADVLNAGRDPHLMVAAEILSISYEEAERRANDKDPEVDDARQTGKVANFGFPGGLGIEALIFFARKVYKVKLTELSAKRLKAQWMQTFPEMQKYFDYINKLSQEDPVDRLVLLEHHRSKRIRGNIRYTVACNSLFQGLGADMAKHAGWLIAEACYLDKDSPLYGCRIVNFIHDQFLLECDEAHAHDACMELKRLMIKASEKYLPDVPATVKKPLVARWWSKDAKQVFDKNKRLTPWEGQYEIRAKAT